MIFSRQSATLQVVYVDDLCAHAEALGLGFFAWARALGIPSLDLRAALANGASGPVADALLAWEATLPRAWQLVAGSRLPELLPLLLDMPDEQFFDLSDHQLQFQCATQAEVQEVRRRFPGTIWKKSFTPGPGIDWWEYHASWKGLDIHIYACREAPPTCRRIEEEVEVEVGVPVEFETHLVRKTVVRWDCGLDEVQP